MISSPQGDLKHTGHVGLDGAYFGDVAFLGDKVSTFLSLVFYKAKFKCNLVSPVTEASSQSLQTSR